MPSRKHHKSFSGETQRQLDLALGTYTLPVGGAYEPPAAGQTPEEAKQQTLTPKQRAERFVAQSTIAPAGSVTIDVNGESIDLGDPERFPNAIHDRTAWIREMSAKIPPAEPEIEYIRFNGGGDDLGLYREDGTQIPRWNDGRDGELGAWR